MRSGDSDPPSGVHRTSSPRGRGGAPLSVQALSTAPGHTGYLRRLVAGWREPFPFAPGGFRGLPAGFWVFQAYLFLVLSGIDEHFPLFHTFRWRFTCGLVALVTALANVEVGGSRDGPRPLESPQSRWLAAYVVACAISAAWAYDVGLAFEDLTDHATSILSFFLIVLIVTSPRRLAITLLVVALGGGVYIVLALWEWFHGAYQVRMGVVRMVGPKVGRTGVATDPNTFGATIMYLAPLFVWIGVRARSWIFKVGAVTYGVLTVFCVFKTSSRSAMVLLALTMLWAPLTFPGRRRKVWGFAALVALALGLWTGLTQGQKDRLVGIFRSETYENEESSAGQRIVAYRAAVRMFEDEPLFGVGPGNWKKYRSSKVDGLTLNPHTLYGELIATRGGVGSLVFVGYVLASVFLAVREAVRRRRSLSAGDAALRALCVAGAFSLVLMLVGGISSHNLRRPNWFWVPGLLVVAAMLKPDERSAGSHR